VHEAAHVLGSSEQKSAVEVECAYAAVLDKIQGCQATNGLLGRAARQFLKVTRSYRDGLFACYRVPDLPRTTNELEHVFGSTRYQTRYHERRACGRKAASPALVLRGSVRVVAALATRLHPFGPDELRLRNPAVWRQLRAELERRHETRRAQLRFRRDPAAFLSRLESELLKQSLPP
jgi:hypothetical protein